MVQDYSVANQAIQHLRALMKVLEAAEYDDGTEYCFGCERYACNSEDHGPDCPRQAAQTWLDELDDGRI